MGWYLRICILNRLLVGVISDGDDEVIFTCVIYTYTCVFPSLLSSGRERFMIYLRTYFGISIIGDQEGPWATRDARDRVTDWPRPWLLNTNTHSKVKGREPDPVLSCLSCFPTVQSLSSTNLQVLVLVLVPVLVSLLFRHPPPSSSSFFSSWLTGTSTVAASKVNTIPNHIFILPLPTSSFASTAS